MKKILKFLTLILTLIFIFYVGLNIFNEIEKNNQNETVQKSNLKLNNKSSTTITITFEQRNGVGNGGTSYIELAYGSAFPEIEMPTRTGYTFSGYYYKYDTNNDLYYDSDGKPLKDLCKFTSDVILHGYWTPERYYVVIDKIQHNQTSATKIDFITAAYDQPYTYTAPDEMTVTDRTTNTTTTMLFTKWSIIFYDADHYDSSKNPWIEFSFNKTITFSIESIIHDYYNYMNPGDQVTIRAIYSTSKSSGSCIAEGSLITLADGTQKPVELLNASDEVLVWNFEEGRLSTSKIVFIDQEELEIKKVVYLKFSNGSIIKVITEHGFWDIDLNKYVYLGENAYDFIGDRFITINDDNSISYVELMDVNIITEKTKAYSPVSAYNYCYFVNGILSVPAGLNGFINIFDVDKNNLKYDIISLEDDIVTYGLLTYEEFSCYYSIPREVFEMFNGKYINISIGKGLITYDDIGLLIDRYSKYF